LLCAAVSLLLMVCNWGRCCGTRMLKRATADCTRLPHPPQHQVLGFVRTTFTPSITRPSSVDTLTAVRVLPQTVTRRYPLRSCAPNTTQSGRGSGNAWVKPAPACPANMYMGAVGSVTVSTTTGLLLAPPAATVVDSLVTRPSPPIVLLALARWCCMPG
jgi:hypothetical protein